MQNFLQKISDKTSIIVLILILIFSGTLMLVVSRQESAIMDELAHIPAGQGYVSQLDYRLNPEHPPLLKILSQLPVFISGVNFPTTQPSWTNEINGQWEMGDQFIYKANGQNADKIIFISRLFPIILTLLLIVLIYIFSSKLIGKKWALIPAFLTALSPSILAHGHYVTTDIGAAFGFISALYFFLKYLKESTTKNIILAGIFFGIAQLLKFSTVLLIPLFIFYILIFWLIKTKEKNEKIFSLLSFKSLMGYLWKLVKIFIIGFLLVWFVYFIFTLNYPVEKQKSDTQSILGSFAGGPKTILETCVSSPSLRCLAELTIWSSDKPVVRGLGQYTLGVLMVMQRASGGNSSYFLGNLGAGGWWYYFPVVFLLKEPLPSLLIIFIGLLASLARFIKNKEKLWKRLYQYISNNFELFTIIVMIIFYWLYSMKSPLNIGYRHIMLTVPLIYILAIYSIKKWIIDIEIQQSNSIISQIFSVFKKIFTTSLKLSILVLLCLWLLLEVFFAYPYYLSYYNQIGGGIWQGYKYVTDSNYDWGQDLIRLKTFVENPPAGENIDKIGVDYFGGGDIFYYLGNKVVPWNSSKGDPKKENINWVAISVNTIASAKAKLEPGYYRDPQNEYSWISDWEKPYAKVGTSIFVYKISNK